jgi:hypothetical protein
VHRMHNPDKLIASYHLAQAVPTVAITSTTTTRSAFRKTATGVCGFTAMATVTAPISQTPRAMTPQLFGEAGKGRLFVATGRAHEGAEAVCTDHSARAGEATP